MDALQVLQEAARHVETAQTSDDPEQALRAARRAEVLTEQAKKLTAQLVRASAGHAMLQGMTTDRAAELMGRTYETARQVARAHGVPKRPTRVKQQR